MIIRLVTAAALAPLAVHVCMVFHPNVDRLKYLTTKLVEHGYVYHVAMDQLAVSKTLDRATVKKVLSHIPKKIMNGTLYVSRTIDILGAAEMDSMPDFLNAMNAAGGSIDQIEIYLAGLGRMGRKAQPVVPALRQLHADARDPYLKAFVCATLVSIGDEQRNNLDALRKHLADPETSGAVFAAVLYINSKELHADFIMDALFQSLKDGTTQDRLSADAFILGSMGVNAPGCAKRLEELHMVAIKNAAPTALVYTLALARVSPSTQDIVLRRFSKSCLKMLTTPERGTSAALMHIVPHLVNDGISKALLRQLGDADSEVAEGAAHLLWAAGVSARRIAPDVVSFLRLTKNKDRRRDASRVLRRIADDSFLPQLEEAMTNEVNRDIRAILKECIESIRNVDDFDRPGSSSH